MMGPGRVALLLALLGIAAACSFGGAPTRTAHSPVSSPAASSAQSSSSPQPTTSPAAQAPKPVVGAYGVLVTIQNPPSYTISLIGVDGKVAASSEASTPTLVRCPGAGAPVTLPVSTSNSRAYFMDAQGVVHYLSPSGESGRATTLPAGTDTRRSMFAVSPDDQRIAVIVNDYSASGASTRLYVEDLNGGGNHLDIYSQSGAKTLWPIGWHGSDNLVLAVVESCTQGGGPFAIQELHVVDPATATRRFTLGAVTTCPIVGAVSPAGAVCWDGSQSKILNWTGATVRTYPQSGPALQFLSPNGSQIALVDNTGTSFQGTKNSMAGLFACGWIDDWHVLAGGDSQHQPRVGDASNGNQVPVAAQGDCAGRLPGGL